MAGALYFHSFFKLGSATSTHCYFVSLPACGMKLLQCNFVLYVLYPKIRYRASVK
jgi:hypothetical protein